LHREGVTGLVVSFDWPSNDKSLNYLEDRWNAASTAIQLVMEASRDCAPGKSRAARPMCICWGIQPVRM